MMDYIVHNLFSTEAGVFWLVLKWAVVVLAAGFIGQFGKAFAAYLIRRASGGTRAGAPPGTRAATPPSSDVPGSTPEKDSHPAPAVVTEDRKKAIKREAKERKKALKGIKKFLK